MNKAFDLRPVAAAVAATLATASLPAHAFKFDFEGGQASLDTVISLGTIVRMQDRSCRIIGNDNGGCVPVEGSLGQRVNEFYLGPGNWRGTSNPDFNYLQSDDGNLNYNKNDVVQALLRIIPEFGFRTHTGWQGLVRASALFDWKADDTQRSPLEDSAKDLATRDLRLLDAWLSKDFNLGDQRARVRVGNQVISWGEDIFIVGGINTINSIDLRRFYAPGTQLKEVFRPAPMASFNTSLPGGFNFEGYYQFRWNGFQFPAVGTYFSTTDVIGKGARNAFVPTSIASPGSPPGTFGDLPPSELLPATVFGEDRPKNSGQWGASLRYSPPAIDAEFAAYYIRYHDKVPGLAFGFDPTFTVSQAGIFGFAQYSEGRDLYGVSMNTKLGSVAIGAEVSYRPREGAAIDGTVPLAGPYSIFDSVISNKYKRVDNNGNVVVDGTVDERKWQAHLTAFYLFEPQAPLGRLARALGAAEGFLLAEAAVAYFPSLKLDGSIPYYLPDYELPDKTSWGYVLEVGITYPNVFDTLVNVTPQIDFVHDVSGTSPGGVPFVAGRQAVLFGLNFERKNQWKGQLGYTVYTGGGSNNLLRDRDYFTASISYSF